MSGQQHTRLQRLLLCSAMCVTCFVRAVVTGGQVGHRHWRKQAVVGSWAHARRTRQVTRPGVLMGRTTAGWRRHAVSWRQCILMFEGPRCDTEAGGGINGHRGQMLSSQGANSRLVSVRRSRVPSGPRRHACVNPAWCRGGGRCHPDSRRACCSASCFWPACVGAGRGGPAVSLAQSSCRHARTARGRHRLPGARSVCAACSPRAPP